MTWLTEIFTEGFVLWAKLSGAKDGRLHAKVSLWIRICCKRDYLKETLLIQFKRIYCTLRLKTQLLGILIILNVRVLDVFWTEMLYTLESRIMCKMKSWYWRRFKLWLTRLFISSKEEDRASCIPCRWNTDNRTVQYINGNNLSFTRHMHLCARKLILQCRNSQVSRKFSQKSSIKWVAKFMLSLHAIVFSKNLR